MRLEIGLAGKHLVEDEMSRLGTVFLEKVDEVLGIAANQAMSGKVAARSASSFPGLARTWATTE